MAIKLVPLSCPYCGAALDVPVERDFHYCSYCGTKIAINDESIKKIYIHTITENRTIDEASVAESKRKTIITRALISLFALVALICIVLGILSLNGNSDAGRMLFYIAVALIVAGTIWSDTKTGTRDKRDKC